MATKKPIVLTGGKLEELQSGDTIDIGVQGISATNNTGEKIDKGSAVNLKNNSGVLEVQLADASDNTKPAHGVAGEDIADSQSGTVLKDGLIGGYTGLTPSAYQYLSTTAGELTDTPPSGSGEVVQHVGQAISDNQIDIQIDKDIRLA